MKRQFSSCFDVSPNLSAVFNAVYSELKTDENSSGTVLGKMCLALEKHEAITLMPPPTTPLRTIITCLGKFTKIPLYFFSDAPPTVLAKFAIQATDFPNPATHAMTYRCRGHTGAAIIINACFQGTSTIFLKEVVLHELAHCLTASFCSKKHSGRTTAGCTPKKLGEGVKGCKAKEPGFLFELQSRGCSMGLEGALLVLSRPCGLTRKRKATLNAIEVAQLNNHTPISALAASWTKEPPTKRAKKSTGRKRGRGKKQVQAGRTDAATWPRKPPPDVKLVP